MTYGYARVSTRKQLTEGGGLDTQRKMLVQAGVPNENIRVEQMSGTRDDRPVLTQLLSDLTEGDTLVVTSLDRISRSYESGLSMVEDLTGRGIAVNILNIGLIDTSTPIGQLILRVMAACGEFERQVILERTREGWERARADGVKMGRPRKWPTSQRQFAYELHRDGMSFKEVERKTGIPATSARRYYDEIAAKEAAKKG